MLGLGSASWGTAIITPTVSGKVFVTISGSLTNNTAGSTTFVQLRYGTGTAPNNGAAMVGTAIGGLASVRVTTASYPVPFSLSSVITGLTIGQAVWFDLSQTIITASTGTVQNVVVSAFEMP